jgi:hypothetical protein
VGLTTAITLILTFIAWRRFDRGSLTVPWRYALRCLVAAVPFGLLLPLAALHLRLRSLLLLALVGGLIATAAWLYLVRRLRLLSRAEVPLLHETGQAPVRIALRYLAPETAVLR